MAYLVPGQCEALGLGSEPKCCRPCGKPPGYANTAENDNERRRRLKPITDMLETNQKMTLRQKMENKAEIKKIHDLAKFNTELELEERRVHLEKRSEKLKQIIEDEMYEYTEELKEKFQNRQTSKIDEMRARVQELRRRREEQERQFVEKKLNQAFQDQCEEMRSLISKRITKEIVKDWGEQIKMKHRLECEKNEEDHMYDQLVILDVQNKEKREEAFEAIRREKTKEGLLELQRQIEYKKEREAESKLIEARELAVNLKIQKEIEEERNRRDAEKNQRFLKTTEHVKDMLKTRDYYRNRRIKREEIVAKEFLKKAVRELYVEQEDRNKAKRELMRSIKIYLDYLNKRDCYNNSREAELQRIIDAVIEEQYVKTREVRRNEQAQRKKLFCNVMAGRAQQVEDLKALREEEEREREEELKLLKEDWKKYLQELEYEKSLKAQEKAQYRRNLDAQVEYQKLLKSREKNEVQREGELCEYEEVFFKNRLNKTLEQATLEASNPYRELLTGKAVKQCFQPVGTTCHPK